VKLEEREYKRVGYARLVRKGVAEKVLAHGVYLMGAVRGPLLDGLGVGWAGTAGYALDLELVSFGLRFRYGLGPSSALGETARVQHEEIGLALTASHFFDLPILSVGVGLIAEGIRHRQRFEQRVEISDRIAWGGAFGGIFTLEVRLYGPLVLRAEGGPITYLFQRTVVEAGAEVGKESTSSVTGFGNVGFGWQF
jgi:hypothetical protein